MLLPDEDPRPRAAKNRVFTLTDDEIEVLERHRKRNQPLNLDDQCVDSQMPSSVGGCPQICFLPQIQFSNMVLDMPVDEGWNFLPNIEIFENRFNEASPNGDSHTVDVLPYTFD